MSADSIAAVRFSRSMLINSTAYNKYPRMLFTVVAIEMTINVCLLAFLPVFCRIVWKSGVVHRNFRLQLCNSACYYSLGTLARFYLFYAQYSGASDEDLVDFYGPVQFLRSAENVFSVSLIGCFALERTIATYKWEWYEKGSKSTLLVYFATEAFNIFNFAMNEYLTRNVSLNVSFIQILSTAIVGFLGFVLIYRKNLKLFDRIKAGAQVGSYSVARTFQVKENVEVLRYMSWMAKGWIVSNVVCFAGYGYFAFGPEGHDMTRALSYNIFEIFVALNFAAFYVLSVTGNSHISKQFMKLRVIKSCVESLQNEDRRKRSQRAPRSETDQYFTTFNRTWQS